MNLPVLPRHSSASGVLPFYKPTQTCEMHFMLSLHKEHCLEDAPAC
jgi:hypothetical protein